jgi:hypothetical protein
MSKFLLNLLLQISKALVNSKIQFLIQKFFFLTFGPTDLAAHTAFGLASKLASLPPQAETPLAGPSSPCVGGISTGIRFPFWFTPSKLAASPSSLCQAGPGCQLRPSPPAARARPRCHRFSDTPRRPALRLGCRRAVTIPTSFSPLNSPLNPPPIFNGVKAINAGINPGHPTLALPQPL